MSGDHNKYQNLDELYKKYLDADHVSDTTKMMPIKFPVALRKMWTGQEVQQWLDENVNKGQNHD
jgi:hypothetical protein